MSQGPAGEVVRTARLGAEDGPLPGVTTTTAFMRPTGSSPTTVSTSSIHRAAAATSCSPAGARSGTGPEALASPGSPLGGKGAGSAGSYNEHTLPILELATLLQTSVDTLRPGLSAGLSSAEAQARGAKYGPNVWTPPKRYPLHLKFLELLTNLFNLLLLVGGIGYLILFGVNPTDNFRNIYIGVILVVVAFINAGIELYELSRIHEIMTDLKQVVPTLAWVVRGGVSERVPVRDLVPGDVVRMKAGDKAPADAVLFHALDLKVDCSALNGESELALLRALPAGCPKETDLFDAPNLLFTGCVVSTGEGYGIIIRTGDKTILGQLSRISKAEKRLKSPLSQEIGTFSRIISVLAFLTAIFFFLVAIARSGNFNYAITFCIGILVSWIPQGLPVSVTMILSIACARMAKRNVLVKDLHGVETLGAITLLATDKTGTLTTNQMTVMQLWNGDQLFWCGPAKDCSPGERPLVLEGSGVAQILHIAATNTQARFDRTDVPFAQRRIIGDATETGLLKFAASRLANLDRLADLYPKVFDVPFSSETKYQVSIHRKAHATGGLTMHVKGAPEVIFALCTHSWVQGKAEAMSDARRQAFHAMLDQLCGKGHRVLAFAFLPLRGDKYPDNWRFDAGKRNYPTEGFILLGLLGMQDPPKSGVRACIGNVRRAGIKVMMITGDHPATAQLVSRKVNLLTEISPLFLNHKDQLPLYPPDEQVKSAIVVTGAVLSHFSDRDWFATLSHNEILFARTSPLQKLEIVKRAQAMGHIVAVTGDGVNDSAALKKADLGISMNLTGSDSSKENAGMILLDDDFASTANGIYEGRLVFQNLKKAIKYSLSHLMAELIPFLCYALIPIPQALTSVQTLAVDLGFDLFITLSFAWECAEDEDAIMRAPPRIPVSSAQARIQFGQAYPLDGEGTDSSAKHSPPTGGPPPVPYAAQGGWFAWLEGAGKASAAAPEDVPSPATDYFDEAAGMLEEVRFEQKLQLRAQRHLREIRSVTKPSYWRNFMRQVRQLLEARGGERLIDVDILLYAYLEAGLLLFTGCFLTFAAILYWGWGVTLGDAHRSQSMIARHWAPFSPDLVLENGKTLSGDDQFEALKQAQSGYFLAILIIQAFNLFAVKASSRLPVGPFVWNNPKTWIGLFSGATLAFVAVFTPPANAILLTSGDLNPAFLLIPIAAGLVLLVYATVRRLVLQPLRGPALPRNKEISGLNMETSLEELEEATRPG